MKKIILFGIAVFYIFSPLFARQISVTDYGMMPDAKTDIRLLLKKLINDFRHEKEITITFPKGIYHFYPEPNSETDILKQNATVGINLDGLTDFTLEGNDSQFIFHGKMQVAAINGCRNLKLQNFSVDWERPFISQAEVVNATDKYLDIKVDKKNYPYEVKDGKALFRGEGWELPILTMYSTMYDKKSKNIAYNTWDSTMGKIFEQRAEEIKEGIIRFHGKPKIKPEPGTTMVALFHVRYFAQGVVMQNSEDILLKNISLYHTLSNGFSGYRTKNITMDNASVCVNDAKGRYFSSVADASHFSQCGGVIRVINCSHTGQGDDFINVHGTSVKITGIVDDHTLLVGTQGKGSGGSVTVGDEYWFIRLADAQRGEVNKIAHKKMSSDGNNYVVTFESAIPKDIKPGDFLECKTWCASLEMRNCKILRRHRARGVLVTTPKDVIIEDNYFSTAGTAILIEGDFDYWYESGANNHVVIRNNVFDNCLTSGNKNGSRAEWGEAVITITPSHIPQTVDAEPYHKNIHIENNRFLVFDAPLLRAVSTRGIFFTKNTIIKTSDYLPYTWQKAAFMFDGCRDVKIEKNKFDKEYKTRDIWIEHMRLSDVKTDPKEAFKIKELKDVNTRMQW